MKITSIEVLNMRLVNHARIMAGLQISDLYIDFERLRNPFYLFIGVNGSGKTTILHSIHPFAYNTAVGDNTSNSEFIVAGQDGSKSITYRVDGIDIYAINHVYTRGSSDTISVKSFISKNGEELNPSGTSGTFKEIIYEVFELDEAYLGLLSLGNTVDNFVEFTGGTRKQLMSKIFTSIGVYSRYYKNASQTARSLKSVLTNVTAKLDRYKNFDKDEAKSAIAQIDEELEKLAEESRNLSTQTGSLSQKIESNKEFIEEYNAKNSAFLEALDRIDALKRKISTSQNIPSLQTDIEELENKINQRKIDKGSYELNLKNSLDYVQELNESLSDINTTVEKMSSDVDLGELDMVKANIEAKLSGIDVPDEPVLDKEKLVKSSIYLDELKAMCADFIAEVHYQDTIADTAKRYLKDSGLIEQSKTKYDELVKELKTKSYINGTQSLLNIKFDNIEYDCETSCCPYKQFYENYQFAISHRIGEIDKDMAVKQRNVDVAKDIVTIGSIVNRLTKFIGKNKEVFDLPTDVFDPENFIDIYMSKREVANLDILTSLIDIAEKQEEKKNLMSQLEDVNVKRKNNESLRNNFEMLQKQKDSLQEKLERSQKSVDYYQSSIPSIDGEISQLEEIKKRAENNLTAMKELEERRATVTSLKATLASMQEKSAEIDKMQSSIVSLSARIDHIEMDTSDLRKEREQYAITLNTVKSLRREQETLMEQYAEAEIIRDAVSPSKGVPLEHIKKFIKGDMISMVNDLLELVYHGNLNINPRDVIINESEFTIPYRKKGVKVSDISKASDGERAILSVAFSLSLARLTSNKYNILLLDEKDTALDVYSRGKYIDIIDAYRKLINCKQVFNVTHNAMFDSYPVNVILTSDMEVSYQTDNVLKLWR